MDGWMHQLVDGYMDEWMDVKLNASEHITFNLAVFVCLSEPAWIELRTQSAGKQIISSSGRHCIFQL